MRAECHSVPPSIIEQMIVSYIPGRFVATLASSWDEWALSMRAQLGDKMRARDELALFKLKKRYSGTPIREAVKQLKSYCNCSDRACHAVAHQVDGYPQIDIVLDSLCR